MPAILLTLARLAGFTFAGYVLNDAVEIYQQKEANKGEKIQEAITQRLKGFTERTTIIRTVLVAVGLMIIAMIFMGKAKRNKLL